LKITEILKQFEQLSLDEFEALKNKGIEADIEEITIAKSKLFEKIEKYFKDNKIEAKEKEIVERIKKIQSDTELLYKNVLSAAKQTIQKLNINKSSLNGYKITVNNSSFIDKSG